MTLLARVLKKSFFYCNSGCFSAWVGLVTIAGLAHSGLASSWIAQIKTFDFLSGWKLEQVSLI